MANCKICGKREPVMQCVCAECADKPAFGKWTMCSERQPREPDEYIVVIAGAASATTLLWDGDEWFEPVNDEPEERMIYRVASWMPLPEPPKGEK